MITLIIVVLFFGIKYRIGYNYNTNTLTINAIILDRLYVFNITIRVISGKFYYYINKGQLHPLVINENSAFKGFKLPRLNIYDANIFINANVENIAISSLIGGLTYVISDILRRIDYLNFKSMNVHYGTQVGNADVKILCEFTLKLGNFAILFAVLHTIIANKRRKYAVKSN